MPHHRGNGGAAKLRSGIRSNPSTPDRAAETLFNWLGESTPGARALICSPAAGVGVERAL